MAQLLTDAVEGRFPPVDGGWTRLPPWRDGTGAIIAMTGHSFVCGGASLTDAELDELGLDGCGGSTLPAAVLAIAGPGAWIDCLDVLLVCRARASPGAPPLVPRKDLESHPRAVHARHTRDDVVVLGYPTQGRRDLATVGRGLGGLTQIGVEVERPGRRATICADLLDSLAGGEVIVAGVAPGNARSLRSLVRAGFTMIGSVQMFGAP